MEPIGWIIVAVLVVIAIAVAVLVTRRRRRHGGVIAAADGVASRDPEQRGAR